MLAILARFYTDAQRQRLGSTRPAMNQDQPAVIEALAGKHDLQQFDVALQEIAVAESNLARNAHVELSLETLFIHLKQAAMGSQRVRRPISA
jgi:hypothetical protein